MSVLKYKNHLGEWETINTTNGNIVPNLPTECNMLRIEFTNTEDDFELLASAIDSLPELGGIIYLSGTGNIIHTDYQYITIPLNKEVVLICNGANVNFVYNMMDPFDSVNECFQLLENASLTIEGGCLTNISVKPDRNAKVNFKNTKITNQASIIAPSFCYLNIDNSIIDFLYAQLDGGTIFNITSSKVGGDLLMHGWADTDNTLGFVNNSVIQNMYLAGGIVSFDNNIITGSIDIGMHNKHCRYFIRNNCFESTSGLSITDHDEECEIYLHNLVGINVEDYKDIPGVIIQ